MELPGDRVADSGFDSGDGRDDVRWGHISAEMIVLVPGEDTGVIRILPMQGEKIVRILGKDDKTMLKGVGEMNVVGPSQDPSVFWTHDRVTRLPQ